MSTCERWMKLAWIFLILINLLAFVSVTAQSPSFSCVDNGNNYTSNSIYDANRNTLFSSLPTNVDNYGFYSGSVGENPDRANAIVFCRGDSQLDTCRSCVQEATSELVKSCPNEKQGVIWYEFCTLRHSNESVNGILADGPFIFMFNIQNGMSPEQFAEDLTKLLGDLRSQAVIHGTYLRKVAAGSRPTSDSQIIYALVQCSPDLDTDVCRTCLIEAFDMLPRYCIWKISCRALRPSCNLRYEREPFYNQTRLQEFLHVEPNTTLPVTVPVPVPPAPLPRKEDDNTIRTVIIAVVVSIAACFLVAVCVVVLIKNKVKNNPNQKLEIEGEISTVESLQYDFDKIRAATNDFSEANKLGQGGFGIVYRGELPNGQEIAVKRLSADSGQGNIEFKNEVLLVAKLQHRNLVRLLGFSIEGNERLLVYEFVKNASLDKLIFDPIKHPNLDSDVRYKIIGGIARGLLYLHEDSRLRIIHRDLKASNVLLDGEMNPKISDFGMARLSVPNETQGNTSRIVGTYGYMAPEYVMYGRFSVKSDVFSFGVLVLEIISGKRKNSFRDGENLEDLLCCAWKYWRQGTVTNLIDPVLRAGSDSTRDMLRCIHIGLLCVQENVVDRPTMASVVLMLSSFTLTLPIPSQPAFFVASGYDSEVSLLQEYNSSELQRHKSSNSKLDQLTDSSKNDVSITELYPR